VLASTLGAIKKEMRAGNAKKVEEKRKVEDLRKRRRKKESKK
jgi:hypothetical protein